jgi:hypothetical protein
VYTKAIFPDLIIATTDLPSTPRLTGTATKTLAYLYLAKAYLTYGWWLQNPNDIPTYPACDRVDPDGHDAAWYFQEAYNYAVKGIKEHGPYSLQSTFYDVNAGQNDRNSEIMLYADHTQDSETYNGGSLTYGSGGAPDNFAGWMMMWNYPNIKSGTDPQWSNRIAPVQREAAQWGGRPWTRMCPTVGVIKNTFADKIHDSRYDGTFATVYRANWPKAGITNTVAYNANNMEVHPGDPILTFLNDEPTTPIDYSKRGGASGGNDVGAGELPGRADFVISPNAISRLRYPGLWKLGPYRTDNGTGLGQPNAGSTRPYNIAKFSELYLVAAEAAVKGATTEAGYTARELVNVLRARAGKWSFSNADNAAKVADYSKEMTDATPAEITINYILDERAREFYGEGYRWFDLVRTQKWNEYADTYEIAGAAITDHVAKTVTRNIQKFHYLRPIPSGQIDALDMTKEEKEAYQNPGY